jgi:PTH1 family peptidyl-tRNA hydrolase
MALHDIKLILGIGNPGAKFENTYHNAGMRALEYLAERDGAAPFRRPSRTVFSYARGKHFIFARSHTYMNESGRSACDACAFFKVPAHALLVLHDDSDIALGTFKEAQGRGAAGHHGVASVAASLGTTDFVRVRIGIRPQEVVRRKAGEFVLSPIRAEDLAALEGVFQTIAKLLGLHDKSDRKGKPASR